MGKGWDYDVPSQDIWSLVFDSLKQGSHLLSFFGSRTYHRGVIPVEDAGFEIRDQLMWLYGSGFPKSLNIGKAVDKLQGNEREVVGNRKAHDIRGNALMEATVPEYKKEKSQIDIPITKGISEWEGWGTALKPAHEPIVMARKPIPKTIAENVLDHGTGGINIDECRVETNPEVDDMLKEVERVQRDESNVWSNKNSGFKNENNNLTGVPINGRFPANVMHDGSDLVQDIFEDKARYFYCAKANKKDRDEGNEHPTVKPTKLMRYLCRLVTPKGGVVLDPFMGSGSTGKAAVMSGFKFVGIEMDEEYFEIACARIKKAQEQRKLF
jgi:site-specific DNA-methyltransferase (adenine-specific)